jgi:hypothetical protein
VTVFEPEKIPASPEDLLKMIQTCTGGGGKFAVKGSILPESMLGVAIRLGWVAPTVDCVRTCWAFHCPDPATHTLTFKLTLSGHNTLDALTDRPLHSFGTKQR